MTLLSCGFVVAFAFGVVVPVFAQEREDPVAKAPVRIGVLGLAPQVQITDLGYDSNVFSDQINPKDDYSVTVSPSITMWLRTGRGLLTGTGQVDFIQFVQYNNQQAINPRASIQYEYRFNRVRPLASFGYLDAKERPGYEIDARVRRQELTLLAGADFRLGSKTFLQADYHTMETEYADDAVFQGEELSQTLNRRVGVVETAFRNKLTPLTTLTMKLSTDRERFDSEISRNSNSVKGSVGFELASLALIRGSAFVGFRSMAPADGGNIPSFRGITADVDVSYIAPTDTRIGVRGTRDIQYSYDPDYPYYVQGGVMVTVTQHLSGNWDIQLLGGREKLDYQHTASAGVVDRQDYIDQVGGGVGYQFNQTSRISFNVRNYHRQSEAFSYGGHRGTRAGISVTYAF